MRIACADPSDMLTVIGLIEDARNWLWVKDKDQWAKPWPDEESRDARVLRGLRAGETWIVWDGITPAATITVTPQRDPDVWSASACTCDLGERAVFVHRLITARKYSNSGLRAELLDWAGLRGHRLHSAKWIRTDVWSTNKALHDFLRWRGFEPCGFCADPQYPSGTLFQKPVSAITMPSTPMFREDIATIPLRALSADLIPEQEALKDEDETDLLFRIYIPSERLYAVEAKRLLSLFRDWLILTRGQGIRQAGYRTASGEMFEFFADAQRVKADLHEEFGSFSNFLTLCSTDPSAAADMLGPMALGHANTAEFVARFGKEVRRLQIDLAHERDRRILAIRHSLEEDLVNSGVELRAVPSAQINALIESLVPGSSALDSLALLAGPQSARTIPPVALNISQQFINAVESTVIQNVRGTVHLGPKAKELLALIERYGDQEAPLLKAAVYELEDTDAPQADRSAAKRCLKKFLSQIAGIVHDVGLDLLEKYLESKTGLKLCARN